MLTREGVIGDELVVRGHSAGRVTLDVNEFGRDLFAVDPTAGVDLRSRPRTPRCIEVPYAAAGRVSGIEVPIT